MAEKWDAPDRGTDGGLRPFDRQALEATLADAMKDVAAAVDPDGEGGEPPAARENGASPRVANPFGRPDPAPPGRPSPARAPLPSTPVVPARSGPAILSGGISASLSGAGTVGNFGVGGISGFRGPDPGGSGIGAGFGGGGLGPRPLGPSGRAGDAEPAVPAPTISLRRPASPEPKLDPGASPARLDPAASAHGQERETPIESAAPARPTVALAGWSAADDDILPPSAGARRRAAHAGSARTAKVKHRRR